MRAASLAATMILALAACGAPMPDPLAGPLPTAELRDRLDGDQVRLLGWWHVAVAAIDNQPQIEPDWRMNMLSLGQTNRNVRCFSDPDEMQRSGRCYAFYPLAGGTHDVLITYHYYHNMPLFPHVQGEGQTHLIFDAAAGGIYQLEVAADDDALHLWIEDKATRARLSETTVLLAE